MTRFTHAHSAVCCRSRMMRLYCLRWHEDATLKLGPRDDVDFKTLVRGLRIFYDGMINFPQPGIHQPRYRNWKNKHSHPQLPAIKSPSPPTFTFSLIFLYLLRGFARFTEIFLTPRKEEKWEVNSFHSLHTNSRFESAIWLDVEEVRTVFRADCAAASHAWTRFFSLRHVKWDEIGKNSNLYSHSSLFSAASVRSSANELCVLNKIRFPLSCQADDGK